MTIKNKIQMTIKDFIYCKSCDTYFDLWKDRKSEHLKHNFRYVFKKELKECIKDCEDDGCFKEEFI